MDKVARAPRRRVHRGGTAAVADHLGALCGQLPPTARMAVPCLSVEATGPTGAHSQLYRETFTSSPGLTCNVS